MPTLLFLISLGNRKTAAKSGKITEEFSIFLCQKLRVRFLSQRQREKRHAGGIIFTNSSRLRRV